MVIFCFPLFFCIYQLEFYWKEEFSLLPHSLIFQIFFKYQNGFLNTLFCGLNPMISLFGLLLRLFQLWSINLPQNGSYLLSTSLCIFLSTPLLFGTTRWSRLIFVFLTPVLEPTTSPRSLIPFVEEWCLETKILVLDVLITLEMSASRFCLGPFSWQSSESKLSTWLFH